MLVAGLATAAGAGEEALRIAVLGHVRGNADGETNRWLPEAVAALARDDPDLLEIPARTTDEPRFLVIGRIGTRHWSAVITYREDRIRLISVRRARKEEVALYEDESI